MEDIVEFTMSVDEPAYLRAMNTYKASKPRAICEYRLDGKLVNKWDNIDAVVKNTGLSKSAVFSCCNSNLLMTTDGRIFLYDYDNIDYRLSLIKDWQNSPIGKKVDEYNLDGELIESYISMSDASRAIEKDLSFMSRALSSNGYCRVGDRVFIPKGKDADAIIDNIIKEDRIEEARRKEIEALKKAVQEETKIDVYNSKGKLLASLPNITEVSKQFLVSKPSIVNCLRGESLITCGHIFLYHTDSIEERLERIKNRKTWKTNI